MILSSSTIFTRNRLLSALVATTLVACGGGGSADDAGQGSSSSSSSTSSTSSSSSSSSSSSASSVDGLTIEPDFQLHALAQFPVGVAVSAASESFSIFSATDAEARQTVIVEHFDQLTAGNIMKMSYLHPQEDTYAFDDADQLVNFAASNGMTVHGHALVWHSCYQVPTWIAENENGQCVARYTGDWETMLRSHVTSIVSHFAADDVVASWDVVNEAVDTAEVNGETVGIWRDSVFNQQLPPSQEGDIPQYIRIAFSAAREADPDVDLYYNDYDNTANEARLNKTLQIADALNAEGLIDGVGFQMHIYMAWPTLDHLANAFQQVVDRGLKVKLTELDIPIHDPYTGRNPVDTFTAELAEEQRMRYCQVVTTYLNTVPAEQRGGVTVWGLTDDESWLIQQLYDGEYEVWPLLFNSELQAKPALQGVADAFSSTPCITE
jgi:endo-1,4-beta-xylanase